MVVFSCLFPFAFTQPVTCWLLPAWPYGPSEVGKKYRWIQHNSGTCFMWEQKRSPKPRQTTEKLIRKLVICWLDCHWIPLQLCMLRLWSLSRQTIKDVF